MMELSLERRMREADVGSQSADTVKSGFSSCSNLWKQSLRTSGALGCLADALQSTPQTGDYGNRSKETTAIAAIRAAISIQY
jgi:hypothetical protein